MTYRQDNVGVVRLCQLTIVSYYGIPDQVELKPDHNRHSAKTVNDPKVPVPFDSGKGVCDNCVYKPVY